jgi:hypothetical protein
MVSVMIRTIIVVVTGTVGIVVAKLTKICSTVHAVTYKQMVHVVLILIMRIQIQLPPPEQEDPRSEVPLVLGHDKSLQPTWHQTVVT